MKKTIFAAFLALALLPAARAEQAGLLRDMEDGAGKAQLLDTKIMEDSEGVVVLEAEKPAAKPEDKKAAEPAAAAKKEAPAAVDKKAEAKPAEKKPAAAKPAAAKPAEKKAAAPAPKTVEAKPAEVKNASPVAAAAKPAAAKPASPFKQIVEAKPAPEKTAAKAAPAAPAAPATAKPAAKPVAAAKPAAPAAAPAAPAVKPVKVEAFPATFEVQAPPKAAPAPSAAAAPAPAAAKPAVAKPAAAPAAPVAAVAPEQKPAEGDGFAVDKKHLVADGDTLWDLSGKYYHDPYKWGKIYNANLNTVQDPDRIYPKSELVIPGITEVVRPEKPVAEAAPEAAPEGEGGVSDMQFQKAEVVPKGGGEVSDVTYSKPSAADYAAAAAAPVIKTDPKAGVMRDDLDSFSKNDLSSEMPVDQKEWSTFIKVVPDNWQPDAVVTGRVKTGYDSVDEGLSISGEKVALKLASGVTVKAGDMLTLYLRGAAAFDKKGKRIGRELQPAGTAQVVSAGDGTAVVSVIDASTTVRKGMVAKVSMRF